MYTDFKDKGNNISYELYRKPFEKQNIGFGENRTDDCEICLKYRQHKNDNKENEHLAENCEKCNEGLFHLQKASNARECYRNDITKPNVYAVDMQKVIIIPKLTTKESFFVSRLVCFNETFATNCDDKPNYAIIWHEGLSGRKASDVTSSYVKFFTESEEKYPILWADNCSAQNKSWLLYSSLVQVFNSDWGPQEVKIKYLETGHTFMAADSVHGSIGKRMRYANEILDFKDLTDLVTKSARNFKVAEMKTDDFYNFKPGNKRRNTNNVELPLLNNVAEVMFVKGSRLMYYKLTHDTEEYCGVDFLVRNFKENTLPGKHARPRGISRKKKDGILKLMSHLPPIKRKFFGELVENDKAEDLVHARDS